MGRVGATGLWIELLGTIRAHAGDEEVTVGPPQQRAVLAMLALRANQTVSRDELLDGIWGETAPKSAPASIHTYVHGLRRSLASATFSDVLVTVGAGYQLLLDPSGLDISVVEADARRAREMAAAGDAATAAELLNACRTLWRGVPLSGLPGPFADSERARLTNLRYDFMEQWAESMLAAGRHRELCTELEDAVRAEPLRERLRMHLMLAMYRSGRRADALAEFDAIRHTLAEELGIDPGKELGDLHVQMLRADPALDIPAAEQHFFKPASASVPDSTAAASSPLPESVIAQLPPSVPDFVGRSAELQQLTEWRAMSGTQAQAVLISAIDGVGGIGKTSLAVCFAHQVTEHYPDGQIYLNLRGFDPTRPPLSVSEALVQLLRSLGASNQLPTQDAQVGQYRSLLAGKRMLIVLDNAASAEQVRELLPGQSSSMVLITSRNRLGGLVARDGARRLTLGLLSNAEALELLRNTVGRRRIDDESDAASLLVQLCGYLPLALRVASERIAAKQGATISELVAELDIEQNRLDALRADEDDEMSSIRAVFSWSYTSLEVEPARAFRYLGLHPGLDISVSAAAVLVNRPIHDTEEILSILNSRHMIERVSADRYALHNLLQVYASELAAVEESPDDRVAAVHDLMIWHLHVSNAERISLLPFRLAGAEPRVAFDFDSHESYYAWHKAESANTLALTRCAAERDEHEIAWQLAWSTYDQYYSTGLLTEWIQILDIGLSSAEKLADPIAIGHILNHRSVAYSRIGENDTAVQYLERGIALMRKAGNDQLLASMSVNLGSVFREMGHYERGITHTLEALELVRALESPYREAGCLDALCELYVESGQPEEAIAYGEAALELAQSSAATLLEANLHINIAHAHRDIGDIDAASRSYAAALRLCEAVGDRYHEALALLGLAQLHSGSETYAAARQHAERALVILDSMHAEEADIARSLLSMLPDS